MLEVVLSPRAQKGLRNLSAENRSRIIAALKIIQGQQRSDWKNVEKLSGVSGGYRLRVGTIRALFLLNDAGIYIYRIEKRGDVYKQ